MSFSNTAQHIKFLWGQGGIDRLASHLKENVLFDVLRGVDTSSWLETDKFENPPEAIAHGVRYRASYASEIEFGIRAASDLLPQASFFDVGCGKGKVLAAAATSKLFDRVVGLDYYWPFVATAQANLLKLKKDAEILYHDASEFSDYDPVSVIYAYNPFDDVIMAAVKKQIEERCEKAVFIYNKPVHAHLFDDWTLHMQKTDRNEDRNTSIFTYNL